MPTVTLHSGLFNSKTTTEPATKVPIHAHQPTNSALPKLMGVNILGFIGDGERSPACTFRGRHHFTAVLRKEWMSHWWRWRSPSALSCSQAGSVAARGPILRRTRLPCE